MSTIPDPKAELVLSIASNYADDKELARLPVDLGITIKGSPGGQVSLDFNPDAMGDSVLDALEKFVRDMREERRSAHLKNEEQS